MASRIPIARLEFGAEEEELVLGVLRSGRLAQGLLVEQLEGEFAALCGVNHAIAVNSGTTALVAALRSLDLQAGDEVITTPFTFVATLNAILAVGATARFADIDDESFTIDPDAVQSLIGSRTRAVLPVHLYGQPADMTRIKDLADRHGLHVIEDTAQAHGASIGTRAVGSFGTGCFSFYATKNITTGEGGMITTNDGRLADYLRLLRNQGMRRRYEYEMVGANYRLTDLQAALALPQLAHLEVRTKRRQENAAHLSRMLASLEGVKTPTALAGRSHVFHQYTIRVGSQARESRDTLAALLDQEGVETGIYYPRPVYDYQCYREHPCVVVGNTPRAEAAAKEVLSLPVHCTAEADVARIGEAVVRALA